MPASLSGVLNIASSPARLSRMTGTASLSSNLMSAASSARRAASMSLVMKRAMRRGPIASALPAFNAT